jgi:hypothetical protein
MYQDIQLKDLVFICKDRWILFQLNPKKKKEFGESIKERLSKIHKTPPHNIIINSFTSGSITVNYTIKIDDKDIYNLNEINYNEFKKLFPNFISYEIHPSLKYMRIDSTSFAPAYNRDFSIDSNCPKNESRGCQPYYPPGGWVRYGLSVGGKYDNGNNIWLGMNNGPGEWCVGYHGTAHSSVKDITSSPLNSGSNNAYGKGIYCSPDVKVAEGYCKSYLQLDTKDGKKNYKYIFMCRVNVSNIHRCTTSPCPYANNPTYTVHFTTSPNIWFVNMNNSNYEYIRQYGILIKEN